MSCPSEQQLEQLLEEQLADLDLRSLTHHVSTCDAWQATLESMTGAISLGGSSRSIVLRAHKSVPADKEPLSPFLARLKETSAPDSLPRGNTGGQADTASRRRDGSRNASRGLPLVPGY